MQSLERKLYNLTNSEYRPALREYLQINKDIIEKHLFHSQTWYVEKQTNGAVVLIKIREVYQLLLDLPESLKNLSQDEKDGEDLLKTVNNIIEEMS